MKKGNLPAQECELINVCMQTVENGTPLTCDDCGRTIFYYCCDKREKRWKYVQCRAVMR